MATIYGVYISQSSQRDLQDRFNESVLSEINELRDHYQQAGFFRLTRVISEKAQEPGAFLLLVTNIDGSRIAGNIEPLSHSILNQDDGSTIQIRYQKLNPDTERTVSRPAIVRVFRLQEGGKFVIGRDISEFVHFSNILNRSLILFVVGMMVLTTLGWLYFGRRALKRINSVSDYN